jgi:hypothetical protein
MPGRSASAAYSAGWSAKPSTARRKPPASSTAGARARSRSVPAPDRPDPCRIEVGERVEERIRPEVERVVVGQRDAVDAEVCERLRGPRRSAEVEDPPRRRLAARGDAVLEVEDEEVGLPNEVDELRREERVRGLRLQPLGDSAPEHRVAPERELHDSRRRSSSARVNYVDSALSQPGKESCVGEEIAITRDDRTWLMPPSSPTVPVLKGVFIRSPS